MCIDVCACVMFCDVTYVYVASQFLSKPELSIHSLESLKVKKKCTYFVLTLGLTRGINRYAPIRIMISLQKKAS